MRESASDFRDTLQGLIDMSPEPAEHPSADRWLAYQRGELPAEEETGLQEHLARCRDCFDLAAGAAAFAAPDTGEDIEAAALWRLLQPQLQPLPSNVREISAGRRRPSWVKRLPIALAALFFVALVGLTFWSLGQQSTLDALRAPRPDPLVFDFSAGERDSVSPSAERTLSALATPWMLVLHPPEELPVYRLALRDAAAGRELWSYELHPDQDLALKIQLPEGLRPGRYGLELSDGAIGGRVLKTYLLTVTEPEH